jgi:hypothetical protein
MKDKSILWVGGLLIAAVVLIIMTTGDLLSVVNQPQEVVKLNNLMDIDDIQQLKSYVTQEGTWKSVDGDCDSYAQYGEQNPCEGSNYGYCVVEPPDGSGRIWVNEDTYCAENPYPNFVKTCFCFKNTGFLFTTAVDDGSGCTYGQSYCFGGKIMECHDGSYSVGETCGSSPSSCNDDTPGQAYCVDDEEEYECFSDSDCGSAGFTGSAFCKYGDVYRRYREPDCTDHFCGADYSTERVERCDDDCDDGECVSSCDPESCNSLDKECGSWSDGCGDTLNCGACSDGFVCEQGQCEKEYECVEDLECDSGFNCVEGACVCNLQMIEGKCCSDTNSNSVCDDEELICQTPYILNEEGNDCCLDKNNNEVCDNQEPPPPKPTWFQRLWQWFIGLFTK